LLPFAAVSSLAAVFAACRDCSVRLCLLARKLLQDVFSASVMKSLLDCQATLRFATLALAVGANCSYRMLRSVRRWTGSTPRRELRPVVRALSCSCIRKELFVYRIAARPVRRPSQTVQFDSPGRVTWRFYMNKENLWRWQRVTTVGTVIDESPEASADLENCIASAKRCGYVYQESQPRAILRLH
jgi:hypothetical protein